MKVTKSRLTKKQDYSTLLNSTKVWKERCKVQDFNSNEPKKLQYIKDVPRLYVIKLIKLCIFKILICISKIYISNYIWPHFSGMFSGETKNRQIKDVLALSGNRHSSFNQSTIIRRRRNTNPKYWYILMFIFLYERIFLFLSDDVHNKL